MPPGEKRRPHQPAMYNYASPLPPRKDKSSPFAELIHVMAQALAVRAALGAGERDVPERVGTGIAIARGIGGAADAERVEDKEESARHQRVIVACLRPQT